jgi:hypothetical protein
LPAFLVFLYLLHVYFPVFCSNLHSTTPGCFRPLPRRNALCVLYERWIF